MGYSGEQLEGIESYTFRYFSLNVIFLYLHHLPLSLSLSLSLSLCGVLYRVTFEERADQESTERVLGRP